MTTLGNPQEETRTVQVKCAVTPTEKHRIDALAEALDITVSNLIRNMLRDFMSQQKGLKSKRRVKKAALKRAALPTKKAARAARARTSAGRSA